MPSTNLVPLTGRCEVLEWIPMNCAKDKIIIPQTSCQKHTTAILCVLSAISTPASCGLPQPSWSIALRVPKIIYYIFYTSLFYNKFYNIYYTSLPHLGCHSRHPVVMLCSNVDAMHRALTQEAPSVTMRQHFHSETNAAGSTGLRVPELSSLYASRAWLALRCNKPGWLEGVGRGRVFLDGQWAGWLACQPGKRQA